MKIKDEIKVARVRKNLSQQGLADILGVTQQLVSEWERGEEQVAKRHWEKLKSDFGVDVESIINSDGVQAEQIATQTNTTRSIGNVAGMGQHVHMDESGITLTGYDERNPPPGVNADSWAELMHWILKHPSIVPGLVIEARRIGGIFDSVVPNR